MKISDQIYEIMLCGLQNNIKDSTFADEDFIAAYKGVKLKLQVDVLDIMLWAWTPFWMLPILFFPGINVFAYVAMMILHFGLAPTHVARLEDFAAMFVDQYTYKTGNVFMGSFDN